MDRRADVAIDVASDAPAGAIGKVAIYDELLSQAQLTAHYEAMTNAAPTGSCQGTRSF